MRRGGGQLVAPFVPQETTPAWDRASFVPSEGTRAAFEHSRHADQFELRAREGLGVSVRFPATRMALWHPEAQGLPVHVTHDACLPSVSLPPSLIESLRSVLENAADQQHSAAGLQLELAGQVTSVDHQLAYGDSMTRGRLQVVLDVLRHRGEQAAKDSCWGAAGGDGSGVRAAFFVREQLGAAESEMMLSANEKAAFVASLDRVLKARQHLASALDYLRLSLLCARSNGHTLTLVCHATVACVSFMLTPLRLLKVIPTTLSQTLYERVTVDAPSATGYLSMDQTRRLLLIPELDPKVRQVPLVGVWVSGVDSLADSYVWAALARYLHCEELGEKVTCHDGAFLCLFYHRTALRQPPALLQVRVHSVYTSGSSSAKKGILKKCFFFCLLQVRIHSGQAMFVHAASSALVLPLGHARAMGGGGGGSRAHALLEFDAKRAQYSYAPDYGKKF